jgi:hypothetical protein
MEGWIDRWVCKEDTSKWKLRTEGEEVEKKGKKNGGKYKNGQLIDTAWYSNGNAR